MSNENTWLKKNQLSTLFLLVEKKHIINSSKKQCYMPQVKTHTWNKWTKTCINMRWVIKGSCDGTPQIQVSPMAKLIKVYLYQNITDCKVMRAGSMGVCLLQNPQNPEKSLACNNNSVCWLENIRPKQANCTGSNEWYLLFLL